MAGRGRYTLSMEGYYWYSMHDSCSRRPTMSKGCLSAFQDLLQSSTGIRCQPPRTAANVPCPGPNAHAHARYRSPVNPKKALIGLIGSSPVYRSCSPGRNSHEIKQATDRVPSASCTDWACVFIDFEAPNSRIGAPTHLPRIYLLW